MPDDRGRWRSELGRDLAGAGLAIGGVIALIVVLNLVAGHTPAPSTIQQGPVVAESPSAEPSAQAPSTQPSATAPPVVVVPSAAPSVAPAKPALFVLNSTDKQGLAKRAAAQYRAKGWPITDTGNTALRVAESTVFYLPGQEEAAARLVREFPGLKRTAPRPKSLEGRGLTVVLTGDYPA